MMPRRWRRPLAALLLNLLTAFTLWAAPSQWALLTVPSAPMRSEPRHSAEMETQYTLGTPVKLLADEGDWALATGPDGYTGYLPVKSLCMLDSAAFDAWRQSPRLIITAVEGARLVDTHTSAPISPLPMGSLLSVGDGCVASLPDGRTGRIEGSLPARFDLWAAVPPDTARILATARALMGVPYLWGGTTADALDCSGLTRLAYLSAGILLPRNASQQAQTGTEVPVDCDSLQPADLIFMGPDSTQSRITHVAIYEGTHWVIHCAGRVHRSSLDARSPYYLSRTCISARRYINPPEAAEHMRILHHPWYFKKNMR